MMEEQNIDIWWLNEESEQMLNRGYLLKGETVEGAIDRITTAAAKRLYKPEKYEKFNTQAQELFHGAREITKTEYGEYYNFLEKNQ